MGRLKPAPHVGAGQVPPRLLLDAFSKGGHVRRIPVAPLGHRHLPFQLFRGERLTRRQLAQGVVTHAQGGDKIGP